MKKIVLIIIILIITLIGHTQTFKDYIDQGDIKYNNEDYTGALIDYNKAIEISPNHAEAYNNRGNLEEGMGNYSGAIEDYNKAIAINPSYADAYYNRGFIRIHCALIIYMNKLWFLLF